MEGPLWRTAGEGQWRIRLDAHWGDGWQLCQQATAAARAESERLAYVAVTRARRQLLLVWAPVAGQEGAPLPAWLFGSDALDVPRNSLDRIGWSRLWPNAPGHQHPASARPVAPGSRWRQQPETTPLGLGATPTRIDRSWGRASYSAWIATAEDPLMHEQGRDRDPGEEEAHLPPPKTWPDCGPLGLFPRGATAGDCLHRILEQFPFTAAEAERSNAVAPADLIPPELRRAGLEPELTDSVLEGLQRVLQTPLGGRWDL